MKLQKVTFPPSYDQPAIVIQQRGDGLLEVDWLRSYFLDAVVSGEQFKAGQTIQVGWTLLSIRADEEGNLVLWEPDFLSMPIVWTEGVDTMLRHLSLQRAVCEALGAIPVFPTLQHSAVLSSGFCGSGGDDFIMARDQPSASDSGWLCRRRLEMLEGAKHYSLFEAALGQRRIVPFIALPPGSVVSHASDEIEIELDGRRISSKASDLLGRLVSQ